MDYGNVLCWATNPVGRQSEPCVYHIIPAGKFLQKYENTVLVPHSPSPPPPHPQPTNVENIFILSTNSCPYSFQILIIYFFVLRPPEGEAYFTSNSIPFQFSIYFENLDL